MKYKANIKSAKSEVDSLKTLWHWYTSNNADQGREKQKLPISGMKKNKSFQIL